MMKCVAPKSCAETEMDSARLQGYFKQEPLNLAVYISRWNGKSIVYEKVLEILESTLS